MLGKVSTPQSHNYHHVILTYLLPYLLTYLLTYLLHGVEPFLRS